MTLRVRIEIVPYGVESHTYPLSTVDISNVTYEKTFENEYGELSDYEYTAVSSDGGPVQTGEIMKHRRSDGYYTLIKRVVSQLERDPVH